MVDIKKLRSNKHNNNQIIFQNTKISITFYKKLVLCIICDKYGSNDEEIFKEVSKTLKIPCSINNMNE